MALTLITPATDFPITLEELKNYLHLTHDDEDGLLQDVIIPTAIETIQSYIRKAICPQTWDYKIDKFPCGLNPIIEIPKGPVKEITYLKYRNTEGVLTTLDSSQYVLDKDSQLARIAPATNTTFPNTDENLLSVQIRLVLGYENVPLRLKMACLYLGTHLFNHRGIINLSTTSSEPKIIPFTIKAMLDPFRNLVI